MSKYLRQIIHKSEFDGDSVTVVMNPMNTVDALSLQGVDGETSAATLFQPLMTKYLVSVSGLHAADGSEVSKDEFLTALYFLPILAAAGMDLLNGSRIQNPTPPAS